MWRCRRLLLCTPQMSNLGHAVACRCRLRLAGCVACGWAGAVGRRAYCVDSVMHTSRPSCHNRQLGVGHPTQIDMPATAAHHHLRRFAGLLVHSCDTSEWSRHGQSVTGFQCSNCCAVGPPRQADWKEAFLFDRLDNSRKPGLPMSMQRATKHCVISGQALHTALTAHHRLTSCFRTSLQAFLHLALTALLLSAFGADGARGGRAILQQRRTVAPRSTPRPTAPRPTRPRPTRRPTAPRPTAPRPTAPRPTAPRPTAAPIPAATPAPIPAATAAPIPAATAAPNPCSHSSPHPRSHGSPHSRSHTSAHPRNQR